MLKRLSPAFICLLFLMYHAKAVSNFDFYTDGVQKHFFYPGERGEAEVELTGSQQLKTIELQADLTTTNFTAIELEKSYKGTDYTTIAMLTGFAQTRNKLLFVDNDPVPRDQYYRLKCTRKDGSFIYSSVATVTYTEDTRH
jgi:hypothetical protein